MEAQCVIIIHGEALCVPTAPGMWFLVALAMHCLCHASCCSGISRYSLPLFRDEILIPIPDVLTPNVQEGVWSPPAAVVTQDPALAVPSTASPGTGMQAMPNAGPKAQHPKQGRSCLYTKHPFWGA